MRVRGREVMAVPPPRGTRAMVREPSLRFQPDEVAGMVPVQLAPDRVRAMSVGVVTAELGV